MNGFKRHSTYLAYMVNNKGQVFSTKTQKILKPRPTWAGYLRVCLRLKGKSIDRYVHRLVLETWHSFSNLQVNHIDGDKKNNNINNLVWSTQSENMLHRSRVLGSGVGTCFRTAKLNPSKIKTIKSLLGKISQQKIADKLGVSRELISRIKCGRAWAHLRGV